MRTQPSLILLSISILFILHVFKKIIQFEMTKVLSLYFGGSSPETLNCKSKIKSWIQKSLKIWIYIPLLRSIRKIVLMLDNGKIYHCSSIVQLQITEKSISHIYKNNSIQIIWVFISLWIIYTQLYLCVWALNRYFFL